ncbi:NEW3 domain-containing protein [Roseisolibacter agri]|uniref:Alpha-galactosidase NEW3 domain-containing protein n=1 Tax=Roseisolibacter agri TaxID=2014610 RepID=A0AA37QB48_9BACT|nr:NEW3 domain-containing protein [Roseisolibacter agri]GLC27062.1 hypothetical protein rosag_35750 [Roseisolibacter agri]
MRRLPRHSALHLALLGAALAIGAPNAFAQPTLADARGTTPTAPAARDDRRPATGPARPADAPTAIRAATLVVRAAPRGFHVVTIPLPAQFGADRRAEYVVLPTGVAPILGRHAGALAPGAGARTVSLTVGVPTDVRAGLVPAGSVVFSTPGLPDVEVPIALDVAPRRRVELAVTEALRAVRAGDRFSMRYQLVNLGNAADTLAVRVQLPQGWRAEGGDGVTAIAPGAAVTRTLHVAVPRDVGRGNVTLRLTALARGVAVASTDAAVELLGADGSSSGAAGSTIRVGATSVRGPWTGTPVGLSYAMDGHLTDAIQLSARAVTAPDPASAAGMALARTGLVDVTPSVALWTPAWRLAAGPVGGTLTDLTGTAVGGRGASLLVTRPGWGMSLLATRPGTGATAFGTDALFGQASRQVGRLRVSTSVSSLRESLGPLGDPRRLDAVSAGVQLGSFLDRMLVSELGYRRFDGGAGLGASTNVVLRGERGTLDVRATHAAGGSQAFARGTDEIAASASRRVASWLSVDGSAWRLDDGGASARALRTDGWTVGASTRLASLASLHVGARSSAYESEAPAGRFGSGDRSLFGSVQAGGGALGASVDGAFGVRTRTMAGADATAFVDRALTSRVSGTVHLSGVAGTLAGTGAVTDNGAGSGFPARQIEYGLRADQVPLLAVSGVRLLTGGAATRSTSFVTPGAWLTTLSGTLGIELPLGVQLDVEAERNPLYFASALGASAAPGWIWSLRVERALRLPRFGRSGTVEGHVFADTDGDGRRGRSERGVEGIVVRRGRETVVTGRDGRYRFVGPSSDVAAIDVRSLPLGWVAAGGAGGAEGRGGDMAVVALAAIDVLLRADDADSTRVSREDLERSIVTARDSAGRTWVARAVSPGLARFDALPPGRYVTSVDFSQAREPLRVASAMPSFVVGTGNVPPLQLLVRPRPLRLQVARRPASDSAAAAVRAAESQDAGRQQR